MPNTSPVSIRPVLEHRYNGLRRRCRCGVAVKNTQKHLEHVADLAYREGFDAGYDAGWRRKDYDSQEKGLL